MADDRLRTEEATRAAVREGYGAVAREAPSSGGGCCAGSSCCGSAAPRGLAEHLGYSAEELARLPESADMGLSCGNPTALAALREGEVVLDLGAGGGFDVFLAGARVGATGRAIGVDMTAEMLARARAGIEAYRSRTGLDNVEFRLGEIEHLPVADASVDVVLSNCVVNLSPDKPQVWREVSRVLRPGGRVAISDIALLRPLPPAIVEMVEALVGCVAGAVLASETEAMVRAAGLVDVELEARSEYLAALALSPDPLWERIASALPEGTCPSDYATSLSVTARKP